MRFAPLFLLLACDGTERAPATPAPAPAEPDAPPPVDASVLPDVPMPDVSAERAVLASPPPPPGPVVRAFERFAADVGAAVVRCPLKGGGRATVTRGRASDHELAWGLPTGMEDGGPPAWSPVLDVSASEGEWSVFLAVPGSTETVVHTRDRGLRYVHAPAVARTTSVCTGVEPQPDRIVRGHVAAPRPPGLLVLPCASPPPAVGADGTFAAQLRVPCRLWVEGGGQKSEQHLVDHGAGPSELTFHLEPDPMAGPNGLTDEAVAQIQAHVVAELALDATAKASIEAVRAKEPSLQGLTSAMITALRDREILSRKVDAAVATRNP